MKKIANWGVALVLWIGISACSKTDHTPTLTDIQSSVLENLPFSALVLQESQANDVVLTIAWSATQLFLDGSQQAAQAGPLSYTVQVAPAGTDFQAAETLAVTTGLSVELTTASLNNLLKGRFHAQSSSPIAVEFRVLARYGENNPLPVISGNSVSLTATVYEAADAMQPLYLVGDMNGWNNANTDFIVYRHTNDAASRVYSYTGRLAAGTYFKFVPRESLGTYRMYCRADEGTLVYETLEGGAFYNEVEGYYTITLNLDDLTYAIEPYTGSTAKTFTKVGPIGDFTGWDNEPAMTRAAYDPHQWQGLFTFNGGTTVKFRGDNDWGNNWGAGAADLPWGAAVFDGPGAAVSAGIYRIYFNDLTGRYVIWPE